MTHIPDSFPDQGQPREPAIRRSPRFRTRPIIWVVSACLLVLGLLGVGSWFALQRAYDGRIVPSVRIAGIAVGGLRPEEASDLLQQRYGAFAAQPLTLTFAEEQWQPAASEIGLRVPIEEAVAQAFAIGRRPDALLDLGATRVVWANGQEVALAITLDSEQLNRYLTTLAKGLHIAPQDATLAIRDGQAFSTPAVVGREMQLAPLKEAITTGLATHQPQVIPIPSEERRPALDDTGIATAKQHVEQVVRQPVTITVEHLSRTWSPAELGSFLRITRQAGINGDTLAVTLEHAAFQRWLSEIAPQFVTAPSEPRLGFAEGRVQIVEPGSNGTRLDVVGAMEQVTTAVWKGSGEVQIGLSPVLPEIRPDTLASLGIVELVAEGRSDFSGSAPYRVQNIRAGAAQMQGVLIAPDAEFSFNEHVGAIDETNGFTEGYAIIDGRTQLEWGGGVCQVSTTVFRAAFWAGVPITERNQHSFRIRWYEVYEPIGMDAAIFTGPGGYDLRFVNDTGAWLLLQTEVDAKRARLTVQLYGTKPDREIIQTDAAITNEVPAPSEPRYVRDNELPAGTMRQTDTKRGGMDVRIGRIVRQNGTVLYRDTFLSRYKPWPDIFAMGPGVEPPTPTSAATALPSPTSELPPEALPPTELPPEATPTSESPVEPTLPPVVEPLPPTPTAVP
jgi:vancomycin resistance protein YoaR